MKGMNINMYGKRLKEIRMEKNFSQEDVAKKMNISRQAISKWENDKTEPDLKSLKMLSEIYETALDELLTFKDKPEYEKKENSVSKTLVFDNEWFDLFIIATVICSAFIPPLGCVVSLIFFLLRKNFQKKIWRQFLCIVSVSVLIISSYNCCQIFSGILNSGYSTIEYLD